MTHTAADMRAAHACVTHMLQCRKAITQERECLADLIARETGQDRKELLEALQRSRMEHLDMATLLEAWARESVDGSWSTHQVDANRRRADQCRKFAIDAERVITKATEGE